MDDEPKPSDELETGGTDEQQIVQIIPAHNVYAKFDMGERVPVICWALVEVKENNETYRLVEGMIFDETESELRFVSQLEFEGYEKG